MDVSLRRGHWLPSGGGGVDGVAGMLGILDWLSRHSNWLGLSTCSRDFLQCPWHPMTIVGLKIFRAGRVPGRLLSQYQIAPALGGTNKRAGHSTADGLQPICSLSSAWLLAGPPGGASCLATTQPLVAITRFCFNSAISELLLVGSGLGTKAWGGKQRKMHTFFGPLSGMVL